MLKSSMKTALVLGLFSALSFAADSNQVAAAESMSASGVPSSKASGAASVESATGPVAPDQHVYGLFEIRPSYASLPGEVHTEDTAEVGYQLNKNAKVGYTQYFLTNLYSNKYSKKGFELAGDDGFFRYKAADLWLSPDGQTSFSYQVRVYTPTNKSKADAGYITSLRNQFKIAHKFSELLSLDFNLIPIVHGYSRAGTTTGDKSVANPIFEELTVLNADFHITPKLLFSLPILYHNTKYRSFGGDTMSNRWGQNLWIWPEIDYDINSMHTVGVAYYTDNFLSPSGDDLHIGDGLKKGVAQLIWTMNL